MEKPRGRIRYLMTPGPSEVSPRVLRAMSIPAAYPDTPEFVEFYRDTEEKLAKVFQTKNDVVIMHGECVLGLEAALACVLNAGDKVLVLDSGPFGKGFGHWVKMYGGEPVYLSVDWNDSINPVDVNMKLDELKDTRMMTVVHCETPAGTVNNLKDICQNAKKHGVLTVADAASSVGGIEIRPEEWGVDICVGASQKALSATPLTIMSVSEDAWKAMESKRNPVRYSYTSILDWRETWIKNHKFPYVPLVSDVYALHEAASEMLEEGMQNVFSRHRTVGSAFRSGIERLGLKLWPKTSSIASDTVTAVSVPQGIDDKKLLTLMLDRYGVLISRSLFELEGKAFLVGHMGYNATQTNVMVTLDALERTLLELGYHPN
jgi:aspartate aminotransferase-like enzyme